MKVEELRIGNLVEVFDESPTKVLAISDKYIALRFDSTKYMMAELNQIVPIPLTDEWLVKFGFEKYTSNHYYISVLQRGRVHVYLETNFSDASVELGNISGYAFGYPKVKHVHQLQNLYFALTGEELTIK